MLGYHSHENPIKLALAHVGEGAVEQDLQKDFLVGEGRRVQSAQDDHHFVLHETLGNPSGNRRLVGARFIRVRTAR